MKNDMQPGILSPHDASIARLNESMFSGRKLHPFPSTCAGVSVSRGRLGVQVCLLGAKAHQLGSWKILQKGNLIIAGASFHKTGTAESWKIDFRVEPLRSAPSNFQTSTICLCPNIFD